MVARALSPEGQARQSLPAWVGRGETLRGEAERSLPAWVGRGEAFPQGSGGARSPSMGAGRGGGIC